MFLNTIYPGDGRDGDVLRTMFAARKRIFVDLLKWDIPVLAGRYEIDQFDDADATYLILTDDEGAHCGSARLLRTDRPHILDTIFPELCAQAIPCGPRVREVTRFCLDPAQNARQRRIARDTLVFALADYALSAGIEGYTGVAESGWLQQIPGFGWDCTMLGPPQRIGGTVIGALHIAITPGTPALLSAAGIAPETGLTTARRAA